MKAASKPILITFLVAAVALLLLCLSEISLPEFVIECATRRILSSDDWLLRIDSARLRPSGRLTLKGIRLLDRKKAEAVPFLAVERVSMEFSPLRMLLRPRGAIRSMTVVRMKMPRLPDGYYIPDSIEFPGSPDFTERDEPIEMDIPDLEPFGVSLVEPDILDLRAKAVTVKSVSARAGVLSFDGVRVAFPDRDAKMEVVGSCELDVPGQRVRGGVHGQARQPNIRPMLQALDITNSYQFIDAFTGVVTPVDAGCKFDVNLRNSDLSLLLDLHPTGGAYRGVPLKTVQGNIDLRVFVRDHFQNAYITVGPVDVRMADGTYMTGTVVYENTNDIGYVSFRGVQSVTSLSNALAVADVLNDGTLDCLQPETPPAITLDGIMAVDPAHAATNRIDGTLAFDRGTFFGIPLVSARTVFRLRGDRVEFAHGRSSMPHGGDIAGEGEISFPGFREDNASFGVKVSGRGISLEDVTSVLGIEGGGDMSGKISGRVEFTAPFSDRLASGLNGSASVSVKDGRLARIRLFAGLTDYLAKNVPGVASLVDQSNAELECTITNGVVRTSKLNVSGDVFAITGGGTYSIPEDNLDLTFRVKLFKNGTIIEKLATPITWTFSKLLMEFKVTGSMDSPRWKYVSVIERLL